MGLMHWEEPNGRAPIQPAHISSAPQFSYELSLNDGALLRMLLEASAEERKLRFQQLEPKRMAHLLAHFMTMALSVEANTRAFIESYLVIECDYTERQSEELNLPTLDGALNGLAVAIAPVPKMCEGCAFRKGTMANQSAITSDDAAFTVLDQRRFMCHKDVDDDLNPLNVCAGWTAAMQQQRKEACQPKATGNIAHASRSTDAASGAAKRATSSSSTRSSARAGRTASSASAKTTTAASGATAAHAKSAPPATRSSAHPVAAHVKAAE